MKRKVFVINNSGHDYRDAERFGDIVFCTEGPLNRCDVSQMYRVFSDALQDAHEEDYLLLTSLASACSVASAIMANQFGRVNYLLFDNGKYIERTMVLED